MDITTTVLEDLAWNLPESGRFTAKLENNKIVELSFCEIGSDPGKCLHATDENYLRNVNKALTLLFSHIDNKNERDRAPIAIQGNNPIAG